MPHLPGLDQQFHLQHREAPRKRSSGRPECLQTIAIFRIQASPQVSHRCSIDDCRKGLSESGNRYYRHCSSSNHGVMDQVFDKPRRDQRKVDGKKHCKTALARRECRADSCQRAQSCTSRIVRNNVSERGEVSVRTADPPAEPSDARTRTTASRISGHTARRAATAAGRVGPPTVRLVRTGPSAASSVP